LSLYSFRHLNQNREILYFFFKLFLSGFFFGIYISTEEEEEKKETARIHKIVIEKASKSKETVTLNERKIHRYNLAIKNDKSQIISRINIQVHQRKKNTLDIHTHRSFDLIYTRRKISSHFMSVEDTLEENH
jgi:hypothetical protein